MRPPPHTVKPGPTTQPGPTNSDRSERLVNAPMPTSANISAMLQVTFAEVVRVLEGLGSSVSAAEAHGCLVGALCTTQHYPIEHWLEEIIPDATEAVAADETSQQALRLLYADTLNALRGEDMDLEVLLPGDEISLDARAGGLSQWCQGFLYGFGTGRAQRQVNGQINGRTNEVANASSESSDEQQQLPANVNEILNDLTHIGRASVELEGDADDESEEAAYAEVVEYVRVGVQLIHDELVPVQAHRDALDEGVDTLDEREQRGLDSDDNQDIDPSVLH
jgi:uncharacterized protein